jgi:hypothetical protein
MFERAVQITADIACYRRHPITQSRGFDNIAAHNDEKLIGFVYAIYTKQLDDFKFFSKAIASHCEL